MNKVGNLLPRPTRKEQVVKKYIVDLVEHERDELEQLTTKASAALARYAELEYCCWPTRGVSTRR